jgi:hypothetical protein
VGGGPGAGSTQVFTAYQCENPVCTSALGEEPVVIAEQLPWSSSLEVEGTGVTPNIRTKFASVKLKDRCLKGGVEVGGETYAGSDRPRQAHGTSALHPSFVEFDALASGLFVEGEAKVTASIEGEVKSFGYNEQELVNVKNQ